MSLQEAVKSKVGKMVAGSTAPILVIGGGLSAAQAAIAAHRAGAAVVLRSRRKLMTKCVQMFLSFSSCVAFAIACVLCLLPCRQLVD